MGYFRIFYYISYTLNFIFRMIKRHGKFIFLFVCIAIFLIVCNMPLKVSAAYLGNDDYYDPYYAIQQKYDSICMDFIRRVENYKNSSNFNQSNLDSLKSRILSQDYYIYYQASNTDDGGSSSLSGGIYNDLYIRVLFFPSDNTGLNISSSVYDTYYNINDNIREVKYTSSYNARRLIVSYSGNTFSFSNSVTDITYYIPHSLFHYQNKYIYEYFVNNASLEQIELMYEMDSKLASIDDTLQQQQEYLEEEPSSDDFSSEDIPSDSGVTNPAESGLDSFFTTFYSKMTASPDALDMIDKNYIDVPIPFTRKEF